MPHSAFKYFGLRGVVRVRFVLLYVHWVAPRRMSGEPQHHGLSRLLPVMIRVPMSAGVVEFLRAALGGGGGGRGGGGARGFSAAALERDG